MHINVYVSLKSTLDCEADQRTCENVKFIKSVLTSLFSYVKLLWMILQIWLLVGFQILYVAMYGYKNTATGFAIGVIRGVAYDCTHMCQVCSSMEGHNQVQILNHVSATLAVNLQLHRFKAKCNRLGDSF